LKISVCIHTLFISESPHPPPNPPPLIIEPIANQKLGHNILYCKNGWIVSALNEKKGVLPTQKKYQK